MDSVCMSTPISVLLLHSDTPQSKHMALGAGVSQVKLFYNTSYSTMIARGFAKWLQIA